MSTTPSIEDHSPKTAVVAESRERSWERWLFLSAQIFVVCWVGFYLIKGANLALWFNGAPGDGPFQIFNPLRRIAAGQTAAHDFVFYHGIGVPYLHYPLFALFGGKTIAASELSRQWMSSLMFALTLFAFARALLGRSKWVWVAMAAMLFAIEAVFPMVASPALSQVAIRAIMPVFAFSALLLPIGERLKGLLTGIFVGLAFPFGTEHGIALAMAFGLVSVMLLFRCRQNASFLLIVVSAAAVTASLTLWLLCGTEGALQAVRYALVELPSDKFWFDGTPPNPYLGAWSDLFTSRHFIVPLLPAAAAFALLLVALPWLWNKPMRISQDWEALAIVMLVYGILSCVPLLGYFSKHYVIPLVRVLALVGLLLVVKRGKQSLQRLSDRFAAATAFSALCVAASLALTVASASTAVQFAHHWQSDTFTYAKTLDRYWDGFMTQATGLVDTHRAGGQPSLWSTYSGLLESKYGIFSPAEDYITLSAGAVRRQHYVDKFRSTQPQLVQTMASSYSAYEEWLQNVRWEFYEDLLDNYDPLSPVGHAIFWKRKPQPWADPSGIFEPVPLANDGQSATLVSTDSQDRLAVVRVRYTIQNPWKALPFLGQTPRYFAMLKGTPRNNPVSFPPYQSEFQYPVYLPPGGTVRMSFVTRTLLPGASFHIEAVERKNLPFQPAQDLVTRARH